MTTIDHLIRNFSIMPFGVRFACIYSMLFSIGMVTMSLYGIHKVNKRRRESSRVSFASPLNTFAHPLIRSHS